jgi:Mg2+-importing ATPase
VFTRVSPLQKNRIILALKRRGHVVGFMGDGINDAPSLHTADVGISVMTAADVARDAADVILGQASLRVLHRGILEGRRASGNMMKYLLMAPARTSATWSAWRRRPCSCHSCRCCRRKSVEQLPVRPGPGDHPERQRRRSLSSAPAAVEHARHSRLHGVHRPDQLDLRLTFYMLVRYFRAREHLFHTEWFVESLAKQTLVLFVIRTMGNPCRSRPSRR